MKYVSCRDQNAERIYSFEEAIFQGWAHDNGMVMPKTIPTITRETLRSWASLKYEALVAKIMSLYISREEIPEKDLVDLCMSSFERFGVPSRCRMKEVTKQLHVCELWHGPTLAFKDLGLQVLGKMLSYFLEKRNSQSKNQKKKSVLNLLVGTSGDTGSSAIEAVRGLPFMSITVLYPKSMGISKLQELQMTTVSDENVHVIGVEGSSDDLDVPIEKLFSMQGFKKEHSLGSVNSVNVCRLIVQTIHYFWSYLQLYPFAKEDEYLNFSIPTGAAGHVTAGIIAKLMGLPIKCLVAGTNSNCVFHRLLSDGDTKERKDVVVTLSPSMDIQVPYNLERILHLAKVDGKNVNNLMMNFKSCGEMRLSSEILESIRRLGLRTNCCDDARTVATIKKIYRMTEGYVLDPHTAVGVESAESDIIKGSKDTFVCMACAHPAKFPGSISTALSVESEGETENKFWWLSEEDRLHPNIVRLLGLEKMEGNALYLNKTKDWKLHLEEHFRAISLRWKEVLHLQN